MSSAFVSKNSDYNVISRMRLENANTYNSNLSVNVLVNFTEKRGEVLYIRGPDGRDTPLTLLESSFGMLGPNRASGGYLFDYSDRTGPVELHGGNFGDVLRSGSGADVLDGSDGNDVFEGRAGADQLIGGAGINTASYGHSGAGVTVDLTAHTAIGGDASGDILTNITQLIGSSFGDSLTGDRHANTLAGHGGADSLQGMAGNDRLVISGNADFTALDGGAALNGGTGIDTLLFVAGGSVKLEAGSITGIEKIYARGGGSLDMSELTKGQNVILQSTDTHSAHIIGSQEADRIHAGKGGDTIDGGTGGDKLFAGSGEDTFHFQPGFGRDNVYDFNTATDHIHVHIAGVDARDIKLVESHDGQDTIVTFTGVEGTNKIILHDVTLDQIKEGPSDLFMFGA